MLPRQRGMALVLVLWILVALVLMAAGYTFQVHTETRIVGAARERIEARALAEAAVAYVAAEILQDDAARTAPEDSVLPLNGLPWTWSFGGREVVIRVTGTGGLVDINRADDALLEQLLEYAGAPQDGLQSMLDAMLDFRDSDDARKPNGAEDSDYEAAGLEGGAKDASFNDIDELGQILGFDRGSVAALRPLVTVFGGGNGIDPRYAPAEVLAMLTGGDAPLAQSLTESRNRDVDTAISSPWLRNMGANSYRIDVSLAGAPRAEPQVSAVIELDGSGRQLYRILAWRE